MKECKILHINDGSAKELANGNFHFMEEYEWAEEVLRAYLEKGYEVRQMIPNLTPGRLERGVAFYDTGFLVYLERERLDGEQLREDDLVFDETSGSDGEEPDGVLGEDDLEDDLLFEFDETSASDQKADPA